MSRARALLVVILLSVTACGGEPPDKEMQQAQGAIDAARAAGADVYAADEFSASQSALARAEEAVKARDYRLALNHALDSRSRAQNAAKLAADNKATARVDADRLMTSSAAALEKLRARLKAPDVVRLPARVLAPARQAVTDADQGVQEARAALDRGDYAAAKAAASRATTAVTRATGELEGAVSAAARRRT
jgi:hypothetical protein